MTRARNSLAPVPEAAPKALGLVRVSDRSGRDDNDLASPEIQRRAIADHCARRGYQLVEVIEGIDESGSRSKSAWWARLDQGVGRIESGDVDLLVVWKFSRTARHRLKWAIAVDAVETAGGRLESATEDFDTATSAGRFARGMLAELNAFEAERIGEGWKEAHEARVRSGRPATGRPKWGYTYDRDAKVHRPDPETGPVLAGIYQRYVNGESFYSLVAWLNARGYRTTTGGSWATESLRRVLDAGFGSGRFMRHGQLVVGVHEPVISDELWQAYVDARVTRRARPPRMERSRYPLSGLVRCSRCDGPMVAARYGSRLLYRCETRYRRGLSTCESRYIRIDIVESAVRAWLAEVADAVDDEASEVSIAAVRKAAREQEAQRLEREVIRGEEALARLAVQNAETPLPASVYRTAVAELTEQLERLRAAAEESSRLARQAVGDAALVAAGLVEAWDEWPVERRREALRLLIARVVVTTGDEPVVLVEPVWRS